MPKHIRSDFLKLFCHFTLDDFLKASSTINLTFALFQAFRYQRLSNFFFFVVVAAVPRKQIKIHVYVVVPRLFRRQAKKSKRTNWSLQKFRVMCGWRMSSMEKSCAIRTHASATVCHSLLDWLLAKTIHYAYQRQFNSPFTSIAL